MTMFVGIAAGASLLIGGYVVVGLLVKRLYINGATATLLLALAFGATAAGEFVREGARKPYTVRGVLYSTSIAPGEVAELRRTGATAGDPYPLRDEARYPSEQLRRGAKVHRALCDACHTMHGANALVELAADVDRRSAPPQHREAATHEGIHAAVRRQRRGRRGARAAAALGARRAPGRRGRMDSHDPATLAQITRWLEEADRTPGGA